MFLMFTSLLISAEKQLKMEQTKKISCMPSFMDFCLSALLVTLHVLAKLYLLYNINKQTIFFLDYKALDAAFLVAAISVGKSDSHAPVDLGQHILVVLFLIIWRWLPSKTYLGNSQLLTGSILELHLIPLETPFSGILLSATVIWLILCSD